MSDPPPTDPDGRARPDGREREPVAGGAGRADAPAEQEEAPAAAGPSGNPFVDGEAAADRTADSGALYDEAFRPGETAEGSGLVHGSPDARVLVAGVGYPLLADLAAGTVVTYRVADWDLPDVAVADCSHTPVAAYQTISEGEYETVVLVGAEKRGAELNDGTPSASPGTIHEYAADEFGAPDDDVVERVGESAMGSNTVENVVVVARAVGELPDDTRVITVEPGYDSWGLTVGEFTAPVEAALEDVLDRVRSHVDDALAGSDG